jgi:hypothetical protein
MSAYQSFMGYDPARMLFGIDEMRPHMILRPRPSDRRAGDEMHYLFAARLAVEGALNGLDLAPDAPHASQQLVFFANRMSHAALSHTPLSYTSQEQHA